MSDGEKALPPRLEPSLFSVRSALFARLPIILLQQGHQQIAENPS